ncbi:MAG: hypothetical protein N2572_04395 [Syntrophales bacterium]|nr:hypothetical protein [Syntrophales bacterium]
MREMKGEIIRSFLYEGDEPTPTPHGIRFSCTMTKKTEGWINLPHGGFSMGLLADLAFRLLDTPPHYPMSFSFRLGGSSVNLGDKVDFEVSLQNGCLQGHGIVYDRPLPYIEFTSTSGSSEPVKVLIPETLNCELGTPLPSYRECLVCGMERKYPGLKRNFSFIDDIVGKPVLSCVSTQDEDFYAFSQDGIVHPLPVFALLDEILGWGGFMLTASGAVTVHLHVVLHRPIKLGEALTFFGQGVRMRGRAGQRLMFWSSGGVMAKNSNGTNELLATAQGQYFGLEILTQQMKAHLFPRDLAAEAFRAAGGTFP